MLGVLELSLAGRHFDSKDWAFSDKREITGRQGFSASCTSDFWHFQSSLLWLQWTNKWACYFSWWENDGRKGRMMRMGWVADGGGGAWWGSVFPTWVALKMVEVFDLEIVQVFRLRGWCGLFSHGDDAGVLNMASGCGNSAGMLKCSPAMPVLLSFDLEWGGVGLLELVLRFCWRRWKIT